MALGKNFVRVSILILFLIFWKTFLDFKIFMICVELDLCILSVSSVILCHFYDSNRIIAIYKYNIYLSHIINPLSTNLTFSTDRQKLWFIKHFSQMNKPTASHDIAVPSTTVLNKSFLCRIQGIGQGDTAVPAGWIPNVGQDPVHLLMTVAEFDFLTVRMDRKWRTSLKGKA